MDAATLKYILKVLRKGTVAWEGRTECLRRARKKTFDGQLTKNGKKKFKFYWQCNVCKNWYRDQSMMEVDHIIEIGSFEGDLHKYAEKMYCGQDNLQALCQVCHKKKTASFNSSRMYSRKAPRQTEE